MRTLEIPVYQFDELAKPAQDKAVEIMYDINTHYQWYDCIFYDFKEIGRTLGIEVENIYFSGFSSQGDGACFTGRYTWTPDGSEQLRQHAPEDQELHRIAASLKTNGREDVTATISHTGRYYHEYSTQIDFSDYLEYSEDWNAENEAAIQGTLRSLMKWLYRTLEKEYEYQTSREAIVETIQSNAYEFTAEGNRKVYI